LENRIPYISVANDVWWHKCCAWKMDALIAVTHLIAQLNGLTSHIMVTVYGDPHPVNRKQHYQWIFLSATEVLGTTQWYCNETLSDKPRTQATRYRISKTCYQPPCWHVFHNGVIAMLTSRTRIPRIVHSSWCPFHVQTLPRTLHTVIANVQTVYKAHGNAETQNQSIFPKIAIFRAYCVVTIVTSASVASKQDQQTTNVYGNVRKHPNPIFTIQLQ